MAQKPPLNSEKKLLSVPSCCPLNMKRSNWSVVSGRMAMMPPSSILICAEAVCAEIRVSPSLGFVPIFGSWIKICCEVLIMLVNVQEERLTHHRERSFCCQTNQVCSGIGSINPASSLNPTRFSSRITGHACMYSALHGWIMGNNLSAWCSCWDNQVVHCSGFRITGILSWMGSMSVLASVSYTHLRAHETRHDLVCRLLLEKKKRR